MIWLSPMAGTQEGSVYFDIRDIRLQRHGNGTQGLIRGLLGDGQLEFWGEVELGVIPHARILPQWTDDGLVECFSAAIDEDLLKKQLLEAVQRLFAAVGTSVAEQPYTGMLPWSDRRKNSHGLAA